MCCIRRAGTPAAALLMVLLFLSPAGYAHDGRPILMEINQTDAWVVTVQLLVPDSIDVRLRPTPRLPDSCSDLGPSMSKVAGAGYSYGRVFQCGRSLSEQVVGLNFPLMNPSLSSLLRVTLNNGEVFTRVLPPGETRWTVPREASFFQVAREYALLGIGHIWRGLDHLLFVVCLLLIARTRWRIVTTVTGFTVGHSLTLALSALGFVTVSTAAIEAIIALSIAFLAAEILRNYRDSITWRHPSSVACLIGLLHGLGFASVLGELGLPQLHQIQALLFFNLGVEVGQLMFIAACLVAYAAVRAGLSIARGQGRQPLSGAGAVVACTYTIGVVGAYWFIERSISALY